MVPLMILLASCDSLCQCQWHQMMKSHLDLKQCNGAIENTIGRMPLLVPVVSHDLRNTGVVLIMLSTL